MKSKRPTSEKVAERWVTKTAGFQLEAMSNLRSKTTGVEGAVIWVSAGEFHSKDLKHGPRIKVVLGDKITSDALKESVSVRLTKPPVILGKLPAKLSKQVVAFVSKNLDVLLQHWNGELDSKEMIEQLQSV